MITTGDIKYNFKLAANRLDELHKELEERNKESLIQRENYCLNLYALEDKITVLTEKHERLLKDYEQVHTGRSDMDMAYTKLQNDHERLKASYETVVKGYHKVNAKPEEKEEEADEESFTLRDRWAMLLVQLYEKHGLCLEAAANKAYWYADHMLRARRGEKVELK